MTIQKSDKRLQKDIGTRSDLENILVSWYVPGILDQAVLGSLTNIPMNSRVDELPGFDELLKAVDVNENKASGGCGILADIWDCGFLKLKERVCEHPETEQFKHCASIYQRQQIVAFLEDNKSVRHPQQN